MSLPKSLTQPIRRGQLMVGGAWRAFFAPFNAALAQSSGSSTSGPTIIDLQSQGPFNDTSLPTNMFDLGWINGFKLTPASKIGMVRTGYRGAVRALYRGQVGESIEFKFREMSRMAMKIATGTEVFNLLKGNNISTVGPLSSSGSQVVPIGASGYVAVGAVANYVGQPVLYVPAGSGSLYSANDYIVCDKDYDNTSYGPQIGDSGVPVLQSGAVNDTNFIRKTSDYVNRVVAIVAGAGGDGEDALILAQKFAGGGNASTGTPNYGPTAGAKIQKIVGWASREGGTYVTEWTGLFLMQTIDGSQIALYYPHLAPNQFRDFAAWALENAGTTDLTGYEMDAVMEALAFDDPLDGETIVRYSAYYPNATISPAI